MQSNQVMNILLVVLLLLLVSLCCCCAGFFAASFIFYGSEGLPTKCITQIIVTENPLLTPYPTYTHYPTYTLLPIYTPLPTSEAITITPTSQPSATIEPVVKETDANIPGLSYVDVTANLEQRGFTCTDLKKYQTEDGDSYNWNCTFEKSNSSVLVQIFGRDIETIDFIETTVSLFESSSDIPAYHLGFVATIPFVYHTEFQSQAKDWVTNSLDQLGENGSIETVINGVNFRLWGSPLSRTLTITTETTHQTDINIPKLASITLLPFTSLPTYIPSPSPTETPTKTIWPSDTPQSTSTFPPTLINGVCDCSANLYNCSDSIPGGAKACFDYCFIQVEKDIHRLDGDHDGIPCE